MRLYFDELDSTNTYAKEHPLPGGSLVIAGMQTAGRGRRGHEFYSPEGGIYFSYVKRNISDKEAAFLTVRAAASVAVAFEKLGLKPKIKWVNDIYIQDKKVCGILCERVSPAYSGSKSESAAECGSCLNSAGMSFTSSVSGTGVCRNDYCYIIGIGINLSTEGFPPGLTKKAGCIRLSDASGEPAEINKNALIDSIIECFENPALYANPAGLADEYKKRSYLTGKKIRFTRNGIEYTGIAEDYNSHCNLIVRLLDESGYPGSETATLSSGEVFTFD